MSLPDLKERFIKYLKKNTHVSSEYGQSTTVTRRTLQELAYDAGYNSDQVWDALKSLDTVVYIGNWWNSERRVVEYIHYDMTPEEIKKKEEDNAWFDSL